MLDKRCVVQFLHPGGEPDVRAPGECPWNIGKLHKRKFLISSGEYRSAIDGSSERSERLAFWGEWEPQSIVSRVSPSSDAEPDWLHEPFYSSLPAGQWAQNTDPFVFGDQFHFTICQQQVGGRPTQLARLEAGSVILFGSGKKNPPRFLLDTVFVVGPRPIDHNAQNQRAVLDSAISPTYRQVTIDRWYAGRVSPSETLRLYFGATAQEQTNGTFSFFPCLSLADGGAFARPEIRLPSYVTPGQTQKYKLSQVGEGEAAGVWREVVKQVLDAGLKLGVRADLPRRETGNG